MYDRGQKMLILSGPDPCEIPHIIMLYARPTALNCSLRTSVVLSFYKLMPNIDLLKRSTLIRKYSVNKRDCKAFLWPYNRKRVKC